MSRFAVLGTGMAGFGAWYRLKEEPHDVVLYDKNSYAGGHTYSWSHPPGFVFDEGPHVSFTKDQLAGNVYYNYAEIPGADAFDELPGLSVFTKDDAGNVFHTYSSYARGNEEVIGVFMYLDITPKGRNETEIMDWVRRNDEYDEPAQTCHAKSA